MFHRVKSEDQPTQAARPAEPRTELRRENKPEVTQFKPLQPPASEQATVRPAEQAAPQANPFSTRPSAPEAPAATTESQPATKTEAKDTPSMTEQDNKQTDTAYGEDRDLPISTYARAGAAPAARAPVSAYPGSYSAYSARPHEQANAASSSDRRLTIGAGITLSGEIEACDYLLVEGTVEAALKGANVLDIAESGVFYGTVEINEATIAGRFEGDIAVHGRLTITASGTVTGSIAYKELSIEAGAVIDGKLTPLSAITASAKKPSSGVKGKSTKEATKADGTEAANNDGELFSKAAAAAE
jgi:cytoskeletal protein CcmA (bactofilin family)